MEIGKKIWVFPDTEMPPAGDSLLKGHESVIILNMNDVPAHAKMTLYFEDREPVTGIEVTVEPRRVRCLRTNNENDFVGFTIPQETQYAICLECDVPVVAQYGRLDTRQDNAAFYTVMGHSC
ncbi:MAG: hypothetical protein E7418_02085 [Ruminococcaceae bacterium]|nr:hypothetical protein [Oscillospiraceae bacterium]